jgi:hypothetical protein
MTARATTIRYLAAVCLLPLIVLWRQDNILFTGYGYIDPWLYFGFFRDLAEFKRILLGNSVGEHLSWILPGAAVHKLLAPLAANCILHLGVHTLATVSLFLTLDWVVGSRRAFAATILFSLNPWVWFATAWDCADGVSIAYFLFTMALLTWAARSPVRRSILLVAGMALAALVYSDSDWIVLSPLLPLYYAGLVHAWHKTPLLQSGWVLCRWFGPGCVLVTMAFGAINYRLDGHFWFYASPVVELLQRNTSPAPWFYGLWHDGGLSYGLLFALAGAAVSAVVLIREGLGAFRAGSPAALFSWLFLAALTWMVWRQLRGYPLLGSTGHVSILLPFSFLAIGAGFWAELETARPKYYLLFCCIAMAVLGYAWLDEGPILASGIPYAVWTGLAALVASLVWRAAPENVICGLGGFFIFTALGVGPCYIGVDPHGYRDQYRALCQARARIEAVRHGQPVRFWFDKADHAMPDAVALVSSYSWDWVLGQSFDAPPCSQDPASSAIIAAIASDPSHGAGFVASTLSACWSGKGLRVVPAETDAIPRGASGYSLSLLRVESVPGSR